MEKYNIEQKFKDFLEKIGYTAIAEDIAPYQIMKRCFFGGFGEMIASISDPEETGDEQEHFDKMMLSYIDQIKSFWEAEIAQNRKTESTTKN